MMITGFILVIVALVILVLVLLRQLKRTRDELRTTIRKKERAELCFLNLQTKPHFLTNCLSIIYSLTVDQELDSALELITYLSKEMQYRFANRGSFVTLREEIDRAKNYIKILEIRYPDAICVTYFLDRETLNSYLPPFSLQPLLDNCVKHGRKNDDPIHIVISSDFVYDGPKKYLHIRVKDNGRGIPPEKIAFLNRAPDGEMEIKTRHVGIDNLKFRLYLLYKGAHTNLNYASTPGRGTTVDLTLPDKTDYLFAGDLEDE